MYPVETKYMSQGQEIKLDDKKVIRAWAFFDWANSAYSLVISTAIFPIYYIAMSPDSINILGYSFSNSAVYSYSISFAYIFIAIIAPVLGGIADFGNKRLYFLRIFTTIGAFSCVCLYFFDGTPMVWLGTVAFIISTIGFAGSLIFYDSFLPSIASEENYDRVSATGYAFGYVGSVILLLFILLMSQKPEMFGFTPDSSMPYRLGFVLVGVWWFGFAQFSFRRLPKDNSDKMDKDIISKGYSEIKKVFRELKGQTNLVLYLASFFFYSAGVQTIIYLATVFAEKELNFESSELILTVLILQVVAILGAYLFSQVSQRSGSKKALVIMIIIWIAICLTAYFTHTKAVFFAVAFFVGLVLGGIQSTSRAGYSKLLKKNEDDLSSYFSFYDVLFYLSVVFGTFAFAFVDTLTNNLRYSVLILALFFVIALVILSKVTFEND